jgi:hypothetical protein
VKFLTSLCLLLLAVVASCRTSEPARVIPAVGLESALSYLKRPLVADPAILYRLRVPASGGLRLALVKVGDEGRVTISEPFGSAVSVTAWRAGRAAEVFDLREGCRFRSSDLAGVIGVSSLPIPQAVRLLTGRLPATEDDRVSIGEDGRLEVSGRGFSAAVSVVPDPWRVTAVEGIAADGGEWRVELRDHAQSVPGFLRVESPDGRWAELELIRLQWNTLAALPALPDLPKCGASGDGRSRLAEPGPAW